MNWLLIIIIVLLVGNALWGYKKGCMRVLFSLVSWILVLGVSYVGAPIVTNMLIEKTDVEVIIQEKLTDTISNYIDIGTNVQVFTIPEEITNILLQYNIIESVDELVALSPEVNLFELAEPLIENIVYMVVFLVCAIVVGIAARVIVTSIDVVLGIASKLPLVGSVDKLLGGTLGAGKGLILSWLALAVVVILALTGTNTEWIAMIEESELLTWLHENNIIMDMLLKFNNN